MKITISVRKPGKVGVKSYIDTAIQLGHIGEYTYTLNDVVIHQTKLRENAEKARLEAEAKKDIKEVASQIGAPNATNK